MVWKFITEKAIVTCNLFNFEDDNNKFKQTKTYHPGRLKAATLKIVTSLEQSDHARRRNM